MPETELQGITETPDLGIPNRKKTGLNTPLSCKYEYFLSADQTGISELSEFFTDDYRTFCCAPSLEDRIILDEIGHTCLIENPTQITT